MAVLTPLSCSLTKRRISARRSGTLKGLARTGFGKGLLVTALTLFEVLTSPKEGTAAGVMTAGSLKVGFVGSLAGAAGTPSGIALALTAAGLTITLTFEQFAYAILFGVVAFISFVIALVWN